MLLIDTSVWVNVFRDRTGQYRQQLEDFLQEQTVYLTHFTQLELLQGSKNDQEWTLLAAYLEEQDYLELAAQQPLGQPQPVFTTISVARA